MALQHPLVLGSSRPSRRRACRSARPDALEARLDHVVGVLAGHAHMHRGAEAARPASGRNAARARSAGRRLPRARSGPRTRKGAPRQVDGHLRARLVHRQQEAVAGDAELVPSARAAPHRGRARSPRPCGAHRLRDRPCRSARAQSRRAWRAARACGRKIRSRSSTLSGAADPGRRDPSMRVSRWSARLVRGAPSAPAPPRARSQPRCRAGAPAGPACRYCARTQDPCHDHRSSSFAAIVNCLLAQVFVDESGRGLRQSQPSPARCGQTNTASKCNALRGEGVQDELVRLSKAAADRLVSRVRPDWSR